MKIYVLFALISLGSFFPGAALAQDCKTSSIVKPSPFMGNNNEIFVLSDGSVWQVKYEYEYLYAYYPSVVICPSQNVLIVGGKRLNVAAISQAPNAKSSGGQSSVISSRIDGEFKGWEGETIYKLTNGQIWQQSGYHYHYHYAYSPKVIIYKSYGIFKMVVEGDQDQPISVSRIK
jgi:hypothetical protein